MSPESNSHASRFRVRYAECTAHGDLALAGYINFFSEAAAQALAEHGVDLRSLTGRSSALREAGYDVEIQVSPSYDEDVEVEVRLEALADHDFTLGFVLSAERSGKPLARGSIRYNARRSGPDGALHLPSDLHGVLQQWAV